jgi:hypothetical protein
MGISNHTNFVRQVHVGFDPDTGAFTAYLPVLLPFRPIDSVASKSTSQG